MRAMLLLLIMNFLLCFTIIYAVCVVNVFKKIINFVCVISTLQTEYDSSEIFALASHIAYVLRCVPFITYIPPFVEYLYCVI